MIKVNLLPLEYRKVERTPVLRFVTIVCGVLLSASAIGAFLYVHFGMLVKVESKRVEFEEQYHTKKIMADRSLALEKEAREYKKRRGTIEKIGQNRLLWSRKLDELSDVIHNKGDTKRHLVWLNSVRTLAPGKGQSGGIYIKGYSGGTEIHRLSDFHLDLKNSEFFQDFGIIDNPEGRVTDFRDDRVPKTAWEFDFNIRMKPADPKKKKR
jgi:Tfp pilus assembly protein PilN